MQERGGGRKKTRTQDDDRYQYMSRVGTELLVPGREVALREEPARKTRGSSKGPHYIKQGSPAQGDKSCTGSAIGDCWGRAKYLREKKQPAAIKRGGDIKTRGLAGKREGTRNCVREGALSLSPPKAPRARRGRKAL